MTSKAVLRRQAKQKLPKLVYRQKGQCYYCQKEIVSLSELRKKKAAKIFNITHINLSKDNVVTWRQYGVPYSALLATSEHKIRIVDGGDSSEDNLAASCPSCNCLQSMIAEGHVPGLCKECGKTDIWGSICSTCYNRKHKHNHRRNLNRKRFLAQLTHSGGNDYY